ncbi:MAG: hypothetical protein H8E66_17325 [Planctomycetes bacterium]|nr:hypothetical protein [Planctomycetota bacterium]
MSHMPQIRLSATMDSRQHLVDQWKTKLAASERLPEDAEKRFGWVRQIYARIYRFLVAYYGEGEWSGVAGDSSAMPDSRSATSRMPFVDCSSTTDGLAPKTSERIRNTLDSIHRSNPGLAIPGTMSCVAEDTWVVVAARKKSRAAQVVHRRLVACGIESQLLSRTTDTAIVVHHEDFPVALEAIKNTVPTRQIWITRTADARSAVGLALLLATLLTLGMCLLVDSSARDLSITLCALWLAGMASAWLGLGGRTRR